MIAENGPDLDELATLLLDEEKDLSDYTFSKFAAMYFENNATHSYIRHVLREPLLPLASDGDKLVIINTGSQCLLRSLNRIELHMSKRFATKKNPFLL